MKRFRGVFLLLIACILIVCSTAILNMDVTYKQGINFEVQAVRIPLYLKILDFFDRHYNYKNLVRKIIKDSDSSEVRVMKIFEWTYQNIHKQPEGLPIVDDHVWHIIIRGYGVSDQSQDVFTTLCNYAGIDAFFDFIFTKDKQAVMPLSFVKLNGSWRVFDAYHRVYFKNHEGAIATLEQIKNGDWEVFDSEINKQESDYPKYLENLPHIKNIGLKRANIQSPLRRIMFEFEKILKRNIK